VDAAVNLIGDFTEPTFAILKHNNACGVASRDTIHKAYADALAGDPVSAFGGILIANRTIDMATATEVNKLFCEVVIAPGYNDDALALLKSKVNRIILIQNKVELSRNSFRNLLNGVIEQDKDLKTETEGDLKPATRMASCWPAAQGKPRV